MQSRNLIVSDPEIMGGVPCFRGTRVPVRTLFVNLASGMTVDEIVQEWPSLNRDDVLAVLEMAAGQLEKAAA